VDRRRVFIAAEIVLVGLLLPVALFPSPGRLAALLLLPLLWLLRPRLGLPLLPVTPLNSALLLLLVMVLVTVLITPDLGWSLPKVAGVVYGALLLLATVSVVRLEPRLFWPAVALLLLAGLGVAALGLLTMQSSVKLPLIQPVVERLPSLSLQAGQLVNPNEVAGVLLWMAPLALALCFAALRHWRRRLLPPWLSLLLVALALVLAGALVLTQSRAGLLGYSTALLFLAAAFAGRYRRILFGLLAALLLMGLIAFVAAPEGFEVLFRGGVPPGDAGGAVNSLDGRREIWSRARYVIQDFPFTGVGLNNFRRVVPLLYPLFLISPSFDFAHAHNHLLQTAAELGIPGLIAYLALWMGATWLLWQSWPRAQQPLLRAAVAGIAASLLAYFVYGLLDAVALGARPGFLFWLLLALAAALPHLTTRLPE
jgi:putative inorganic carbon (HCO3(-)) transporter